VVAARDGRPIAQFDVSVRALDGARAGYPSGFGGSNGAGEFFAPLDPGVLHEITVGAMGYEPATVREVAVGAGEIRDETIRLEDEAVLLGVVTGEDGAPIEGLTLVAAPVERRGVRSSRLEAITGADGRFALAGLTAGEYRFEARLGVRGEDGSSASVPVRVRPERFEMPASAASPMALTMADPTGVPAEVIVGLPADDRPRWITVTLVPHSLEGGGRRYSATGSRNAAVVRFPRVAPGEYSVDLFTVTETSPGNQPSATHAVRPETVRIAASGDNRFEVTVVEPPR
jgi:hypothetical protein